MAHKKAAGSAKNLRDSNPKYRGLKLAGGQQARAGNIIVRQKGDKYACGNNVYKGKDFTIHATVDGIVSFRKKKFMRFDGRKYLKTVVDIIPLEEVAKAAKATKAPAKKSTPAKKATGGDDLTKIEGIGPVIAKHFNAQGIMTFDDLSKSKVGDLRAILADNGLSQHDPKTWKKQATLAKNGKWDELKVLQDELNGGK